jgi:hypothetical protein
MTEITMKTNDNSNLSLKQNSCSKLSFENGQLQNDGAAILKIVGV